MPKKNLQVVIFLVTPQLASSLFALAAVFWNYLIVLGSLDRFGTRQAVMYAVHTVADWESYTTQRRSMLTRFSWHLYRFHLPWWSNGCGFPNSEHTAKTRPRSGNCSAFNKNKSWVKRGRWWLSQGSALHLHRKRHLRDSFSCFWRTVRRLSDLSFMFKVQEIHERSTLLGVISRHMGISSNLHVRYASLFSRSMDYLLAPKNPLCIRQSLSLEKCWPKMRQISAHKNGVK